MGLGHYSLRARPLAGCSCCPCCQRWCGEHSVVRAPRARPRVPRAVRLLMQPECNQKNQDFHPTFLVAFRRLQCPG